MTASEVYTIRIQKITYVFVFKNANSRKPNKTDVFYFLKLYAQAGDEFLDPTVTADKM